MRLIRPATDHAQGTGGGQKRVCSHRAAERQQWSAPQIAATTCGLGSPADRPPEWKWSAAQTAAAASGVRPASWPPSFCGPSASPADRAPKRLLRNPVFVDMAQPFRRLRLGFFLLCLDEARQDRG